MTHEQRAYIEETFCVLHLIAGTLAYMQGWESFGFLLLCKAAWDFFCCGREWFRHEKAKRAVELSEKFD
jgi:hypothetical protein